MENKKDNEKEYNMLFIIALIAILTIAALALLKKSKSQQASEIKHRGKTRQNTKPAGKYQSVGIYSSTTMCNAAKAQMDTLFLTAEAPMLPLAACDSGQCACRYKRYDDRRQTHDRRWSFGMAHSLNDGLHDEKRKNPKQDRRAKA